MRCIEHSTSIETNRTRRIIMQKGIFDWIVYVFHRPKSMMLIRPAPRTLFNIYWTLREFIVSLTFSYGFWGENIIYAFSRCIRVCGWMIRGLNGERGLYALTKQVHPWFSHVMSADAEVFCSMCSCCMPIYLGVMQTIRYHYQRHGWRGDIDLNGCECFYSGGILIWHLLLAKKSLNKY